MAYGRLDVYWPDGKIESFVLEEETVSVGRATGNVVTLDTDTISRYHFSITYKDDKVYITDLDSANGTYIDGKELSGNDPYELDGVEEILIGHLRIIFSPVDESPTMPTAPIEEDTQRFESPTANFQIEMDTADVQVWPASNSSAELYITHTGEAIERYRVYVDGLPKEWVRVNRPEVELGPNESAQVIINFKPARRSDTTPGEYPVTIAVSPKEIPEASLQAEIKVTIAGYEGFGMALAEKSIKLDDEVNLFLLNQGNMPLTVKVTGKDPSDKLDIQLPHGPITLVPGQRVKVNGKVRSKGLILFGQPYEQRFDLLIHAQTNARYIAALEGKVTIAPVLPGWALATIGGVLVVGVLLVLVLFSGLLSSRQPVIESMVVQSSLVAQGDPLVLNWSAQDADRYNVLVNGTPVATDMPGETTQVVLNSDLLHGTINVILEALNGDLIATASVNASVYKALGDATFTPDTQVLVRNVTSTLTLNWNIPGADKVWLEGLGAFTTQPVKSEYPASGSEPFSGIPAENFDVVLHAVTLFADGTVDQEIEQPVTISVVDPVCSPTSPDVQVFAGPSPEYVPIFTPGMDVTMVIIARDTSETWYQVQLDDEQTGWVAVDSVACEPAFEITNLRAEANIPPLPPTPTPVATAVTPEPETTANADE